MQAGEVLSSVPIPLNTLQAGETAPEPPPNPRLVTLLTENGWQKVGDSYLVPPGFKAVVSEDFGALKLIQIFHPTGRIFLVVNIFGDPKRNYTEIIWKGKS